MSLGAAVPGTVVPSGAEVSPGGPQGQGGQLGNTGPAGPAGDTDPIGAVKAWLAPAAPVNHMIADGSAISRTLYPALFSLIGTTFGAGDGSTTFNLPDLRSRFVVGTGPGGSGLSQRILAAIGGEENHVLSVAELASHSHSDAGHTHGDAGHTHTVPIGGAAVCTAGASGAMWSGTTGTSVGYAAIQTNYANIQAAGSGSGHNNMPPFICLVYVIKVALGGGPTAQAPIANQTVAGLLNILSGAATDYVGGDNACHPATNLFSNARLNSYNGLGNPNFEVDARTVGNGASGAANSWAVDRWLQYQTGAYVTAKQTAGLVTVPGSTFPITQNFLRIQLAAQHASVAATDQIQLAQTIEGPRLRELFGGPSYVTLLCRSSVAGLVFGLALRDSASAWTCVQAATIANANQWTTVPLPAYPLFASGGTFPTAPGSLGANLIICLMAGSTFTAAQNGIWLNANTFGAVGQSNFAAAPVGSTLDLAFIQHEPVAFTQFMDEPFTRNFDECLRYYEKSWNYASPAGGTAGGRYVNFTVVTAGAAVGTLTFRKIKARIPAATFWDAATAAINTCYCHNNSGHYVATSGAMGEDGVSSINNSNNNFQVVAGYQVAFFYTADTGW